jgi:hypothetical protein
MDSLYIDEHTLWISEVDIRDKYFLSKFREVNSVLLQTWAPHLEKILSLGCLDVSNYLERDLIWKPAKVVCYHVYYLKKLAATCHSHSVEHMIEIKVTGPHMIQII